jgi:hypothetical protein
MKLEPNDISFQISRSKPASVAPFVPSVAVANSATVWA